MLTATKTEVTAIAELLVAGAATPEELAKVVIKKITELREEREFHVLVLELSPRVYAGFGPFPTKTAAFDSVVKNPVAYIAKNAAIVPVTGASQTKKMLALADEPPTSRGDWAEVRLDSIAAKNGWKGKAADRQRFLPTT